MAPSTLNLLLAVASIAAGTWAFVTTQAVTKDHFEPILAACTTSSNTNNFEESGYHRYDKRVGLVVFDFLVCLITQFMVDLATKVPMGLLTWGTTMCAAIPATMLMMLEANRVGNRGPLKWPVTISLMGQLLGISVVFPAVWVPSYIFFAGKGEGGSDAVNSILAQTLIVYALPFIVFTFGVFTLDIASDAWTTCAGILGGPIVCFTGIATTLLKAPDNATPQQVSRTAKSSAVSIGIGGLLSTCGWYYILYVAYVHFGTDVNTLFQAVWTEAHPSIKFMAVDAAILWLGLILHIATRSTNSALQAICLTPFYGPGGACCMSLATLEMDRVSAAKEQKKD